jgi:hypothetical protein
VECGGAKPAKCQRTSQGNQVFPIRSFDLGLADPHCSYCHTSPSLKGRWYAVRTHISPTFNIPSCHFSPWLCKNRLLFVIVTVASGTSSGSVTARSLTGAIPTSSAGPPSFPVPSSNLTHINVCAVRSVLLSSLTLLLRFELQPDRTAL